MATNSLQLNASGPFSGLGTLTYNVLASELLKVEIESTIPQSSGLQIVVNQNATPLLTIGGASDNPSPTQKAIGSSVMIQAAASDVITVVLSSSAAADQLPNAVKSVVGLTQVI